MTTPSGPFAALDAYQSGHMLDEDAAGFEEELFAAAALGSAREADFVDRISRLGQYLLPHGGFDIGSSRARVDALIAAGLRIQFLVPNPSGDSDGLIRFPKIDDNAQLVITHFPFDIRGYDSVDVIVEKPDGTEFKTFRDIGCDPDDGTVYGICEAPLARISAQVGQVRSRVVGTRAGQKHVIAVFDSVTAT